MNQTQLVHQEAVRIHVEPLTPDLTDRQYKRRSNKIDRDVKHITGRIAMFLGRLQLEYPDYSITMSPDG